MDIQVNLDILVGLENLVILDGQVFQDIAASPGIQVFQVIVVILAFPDTVVSPGIQA